MIFVQTEAFEKAGIVETLLQTTIGDVAVDVCSICSEAPILYAFFVKEFFGENGSNSDLSETIKQQHYDI